MDAVFLFHEKDIAVSFVVGMRTAFVCSKNG
jgi:hypothetical protein